VAKHINHRGFAKLRPGSMLMAAAKEKPKTQAEWDAETAALKAQEGETSKERMEREVQEEAARRKARVTADPPSTPVPVPKPVPPPPPPPVEDPNEKLIQEELRRKRGYKRLAPGS